MIWFKKIRMRPMKGNWDFCLLLSSISLWCFIVYQLSQDLKNQIEDLKAQLRVGNLQLKDKEFKFNKSKEDYEFQIAKLFDENKSLKQKYEK